MFKKISAVVIAASLLTAPAFAATVNKTERAPATKTATMKPSVANAKAQAPAVKKVRHHRKHFTHRHARKHMAVVKKVSVKRVSAATPAKTVIVKKKI